MVTSPILLENVPRNTATGLLYLYVIPVHFALKVCCISTAASWMRKSIYMASQIAYSYLGRLTSHFMWGIQDSERNSPPTKKIVLCFIRRAMHRMSWTVI